MKLKHLLILFLGVSAIALGAVKISELSLMTASDVETADSFPMVDASSNLTKRLRISDLFSVPALQTTLSGKQASLPWTTNGDLVYYSSGAARLPKGTNGQYLQMVDGLPAWATLTGSGITTLNSQTATTQTFSVGTSGTDFAISSSGGVHTFNLPTASGTNRGALSAADWTTFNSKQAAGNYITALTGDVTASGPGSAAATVAQVGGYSAANVAAGATLANAATNANTAGAIVKRDGSGNFSAGTITAALSGNATTASALASNPAACSAGQFVNDMAADGTLTCATPTGATWGSITGTLSSQTDLQSALDAKAPTASPTFSGTITTPLTASRAVVTNGSSQLATAVYTDANTASAIVQRDASGNFSAGTISASLSGNASTATALAANPTDCAGGQYATAIDASGNLTCGAVSSGVTTVGAFSGSSQTNGASISGSTITFGPADASNPGMVTTGTQTIAGNKTITGSTVFSNTVAMTLNGTNPELVFNGAGGTSGFKIKSDNSLFGYRAINFQSNNAGGGYTEVFRLGDANGILHATHSSYYTSNTWDVGSGGGNPRYFRAGTGAIFGIGTGSSSPNYTLDLRNTAGTQTALQITNNDTGTASTDGLIIGVDGSEIPFIDSRETFLSFQFGGTQTANLQANKWTWNNNADILVDTSRPLGLKTTGISTASIGLGYVAADTLPSPSAGEIYGKTGVNMVFKTNGGTTALTLDTSQNTTLSGKLVTECESVSLTADGQTVTPTKSCINLSSNDATAGNRTFKLAQATAGTRLTIMWSGTNAGELLDDSAQGTAGNHRMSGDWTPTQYDTIDFISNGTDWHERSRSAN